MKRYILCTEIIPRTEEINGYVLDNYGDCCKVYKNGKLIGQFSTEDEAIEFINDKLS